MVKMSGWMMVAWPRQMQEMNIIKTKVCLIKRPPKGR